MMKYALTILIMTASCSADLKNANGVWSHVGAVKKTDEMFRHRQPELALDTVAIQQQYAQSIKMLEEKRMVLAEALDSAGDPTIILDSAGLVLTHLLIKDFFPSWSGTPWDFNGAASRPLDGSIACGYYVSTVLRDAGFQLNRYKVAQQASAVIAAMFCDDFELSTWADTSYSRMLEKIKEGSPAVYIAGLDFHVGFLVYDGERLSFVHSNYIGLQGPVVERASSSDALMSSSAVVLGTLSTSRKAMTYWLRGKYFQP